MSSFVFKLEFNKENLVWDGQIFKKPTSKSVKFNESFAFGGYPKLVFGNTRKSSKYRQPFEWRCHLFRNFQSQNLSDSGTKKGWA